MDSFRRCVVLFSICFAAACIAGTAELFLSEASAGPTTYYVSASGDDANDGSATRQWRTIARVNSASLSPGDTVAFEGGSTFVGNLLIVRSGTIGAPIVVTSYPTAAGERATIFAGGGDGIVVENAQYVRLANLKIVGGGIESNNGHGIMMNRTVTGSDRLRSIYIDRVETSGFRITGIALYAGSNVAVGYDDVRMTNSDIHANGYAGVWMGGCAASGSQGVYCFTNVYAGYNVIHDNPGIDIDEQTGNGIFFKDVDGGIIEHCLAYNNGTRNKNLGGGPVGIWAIFSNNVTIQYNESFNNHSLVNDGGGFDLDGGVTNSTLQYNYSHDNDGAGYLLWDFDDVMQSSGNVVRYNISENDGRAGYFGGIHLGTSGPGRIVNVEIYGNTIYSGVSTDAAFGIRGNLSGIRVLNNIFMTSGGSRAVHALSGESGVSMLGNDYWGSGSSLQIVWGGVGYDTLASWRAASGQEVLSGKAVGFQLDPQLVGAGRGGTVGNSDALYTLTAYQLAEGSALRDRGIDLALLGIAPGSHDFYGTSIPQGGFDIGAHEATPRSATPPTSTPAPPPTVSTPSPPPPPAAKPGAVRDLAVASVAATTVTLAWTQVDDGTGRPALYDVRFNTPTIAWGSAPSVSAGTCAQLTPGAIGAKVTCTVEGLLAGTQYQFELVPYRGTLNVDAVFGPLSNIASGTTTATGPTPVPAPPPASTPPPVTATPAPSLTTTPPTVETRSL